MTDIVVYTDGSCHAKTGKGGWAYHYSFGGKRVAYYEGKAETTNNRMELMGAIEGLKSALQIRHPEKTPIVVISDSQYVVKGISEWVFGWAAHGWVTADKKPVKNRDLWEVFLALIKANENVQFHWVKGHAGNEMNEYADLLAEKGRNSLD